MIKLFVPIVGKNFEGVFGATEVKVGKICNVILKLLWETRCFCEWLWFCTIPIIGTIFALLWVFNLLMGITFGGIVIVFFWVPRGFLERKTT